MTALTEAAPGSGAPGFLDRLTAELAPRPGRLAATLRIAGTCTLVTTLWMVFQIPFPAYATYIVILVSGAERAATLTTALGGIVAATLAVALTLLFYTFDAAEPALRLPLMTATVFLGMFLSRTVALGPVAFLLGFVLVITQSLADGIPHPEVLTRLMLWLWLVAVVPALIALLVDLAWGHDPARLAREQTRKTLAAMASGLDGEGMPPIPSVVNLTELRRRAALLVPALRPDQAGDRHLIADLAGLTRLLPLLAVNAPAEIRRALAVACRACAASFTNKDKDPIPLPPLPSPDELARLPAAASVIVGGAGELLRRLAVGLERRTLDAPGAVATLSPASKPRRAGLFVTDAWSNPDHTRFALKTTLAAMICYVTYSLLDWPGIRTCMVTCFFVALGSVGETVHKLGLRIAGALLGGAIGALAIIFLIPQMTDIGHLLLLTFLVAALGAWVASGSERIAYAGMQMAFAAFVGIFQDYGPATDLTGLRDRIVGILLGNIVIALVFTTLWPVTVADRLGTVLAGARMVLADLLRHGDQGNEGGECWLALEKHLDQARRLAAMESFESGQAPSAAVPEQLLATENLAAATRVLLLADDPATATVAARNVAADWLEADPAHPPPALAATGDRTPAQVQALALVAEDLAALAGRPTGTSHAV